VRDPRRRFTKSVNNVLERLRSLTLTTIGLASAHQCWLVRRTSLPNFESRRDALSLTSRACRGIRHDNVFDETKGGKQTND
jgi:hypothetical protein